MELMLLSHQCVYERENCRKKNLIPYVKFPSMTASVVSEFLAADTEVLGSILGATRFSE
jgi:hypothetical protein